MLAVESNNNTKMESTWQLISNPTFVRAPVGAILSVFYKSIHEFMTQINFFFGR